MPGDGTAGGVSGDTSRHAVGDVPDDAMAGTRQDAAAVLALWVLRRSFAPLRVSGRP